MTNCYEVIIRNNKNTNLNDIKKIISNEGLHAYNMDYKNTSIHNQKVSFQIRNNNNHNNKINDKLNRIKNKIDILGCKLNEFNNVKENVLKKKSDLDPVSIRWNSKPFHINKKYLTTNYNTLNSKQINKLSKNNYLFKKSK